MNPKIILSLLAATSVVHAGLGSMQVTEQRNAAVGFAITANVALHRMESTCSGTRDGATAFQQAHAQWTTRNHLYVEAANAWMDHVKSLIAKDAGQEVADAFVRNTYSVFSDQASMQAAQSIPGSPPRSSDCKKWAGILDSGEFDLTKSAEFFPVLKELLASYEAS